MIAIYRGNPEMVSCVHLDSEAFYGRDSGQITSSKFPAFMEFFFFFFVSGWKKNGIKKKYIIQESYYIDQHVRGKMSFRKKSIVANVCFLSSQS